MAPSAIRICIVSVSDTRTQATDDSGRTAIELVEAAGYKVVRRVIIKDDPSYVKELVRDMSDANACDVIILNGGTGITKRDNTHEALEQIFEKRIDGFGEAFRRLSWDEFGPRAILTRATAGVFNTCVVFSLPGSPNAVRLGLSKLVLPVVAHAVDLAQGRATHRSTLT
jgi:molybdenum cofactor biosynthesis protein B